MPGGDGTGPMGRGSMTGRRAGLCAGYPNPGYATNPRYGQGFGFGRGQGRGFGRGYGGRGRGFWRRDYYPQSYNIPVLSGEEEKSYLETTIKELEEEINAIRERIKELSKEKKENP